MVAAATTGCRTDEKPPEGLPLTEDTIPDRPQALVSPEAEQKVVNPKTALLYRAIVTLKGTLWVHHLLKRMSNSHVYHVKEHEKLYRSH